MSGKNLPNLSPYVMLDNKTQILRAAPKIKRNMLCQFTNLKFKNCCGANNQNFCNKSLDHLNSYIKDLNTNNG